MHDEPHQAAWKVLSDITMPDHNSSTSAEADRLLGGAIEWLDLTRITDGRGDLTFIEGGRHLPFDIARVYYLYNVPPNVMRAGHAHYALKQLIVASSGSFDLHLDNGFEKVVVTLDRPDRGILMGSMIWREIHNFAPSAVCLVLASLAYEEADYIRDYPTFLATARRL